MVDTTLSDADIAARIRHGRRCPIRHCREDRAGVSMICAEHRDELSRILDPAYGGDRDLERAASIPQLWARLDPTPGTVGTNDRRPPGFHSTPPLNLSLVVMRDTRSVGYPVVEVWYEQRADGIGDDYDRAHHEDSSPPRSVEKVIAGIVDAVYQDGDEVPTEDVAGQCGWLHRCLGALTARDDILDLFDDLKALHDQLRPAAGDPKPRPVASCTGWVRDPDGAKVECGYPLFMPPPVPPDPGQPEPRVDPARPVMRCRRCDRPYTALMLLRQQIGDQRAS